MIDGLVCVVLYCRFIWGKGGDRKRERTATYFRGYTGICSSEDAAMNVECFYP
jgi:hypothetical protein